MIFLHWDFGPYLSPCSHLPARLLSQAMTKAEHIFQLAQDDADAYRMFALRRAGAATPFVNEVINHLKFLVGQKLGAEVVNQSLNQASLQTVDFWLENEHTIMEVEFNILSSPPVLEREIFKALLAKDAGKDVRRIILIGDPGSVVLLHTPIAAAIINWAERHHQIQVQVWELKDNSER